MFQFALKHGQNTMQRGVLDAMALSLGLVCSLRPSSDELTARRPHQRLCLPQNCIILTSFVSVSAGMYVWYMWFLTIQPWCTGGNENSDKVALHGGNDSLTDAIL